MIRGILKNTVDENRSGVGVTVLYRILFQSLATHSRGNV
jgi:hypothetical protein